MQGQVRGSDEEKLRRGKKVIWSLILLPLCQWCFLSGFLSVNSISPAHFLLSLSHVLVLIFRLRFPLAGPDTWNVTGNASSQLCVSLVGVGIWESPFKHVRMTCLTLGSNSISRVPFGKKMPQWLCKDAKKQSYTRQRTISGSFVSYFTLLSTGSSQPGPVTVLQTHTSWKENSVNMLYWSTCVGQGWDGANFELNYAGELAWLVSDRQDEWCGISMEVEAFKADLLVQMTRWESWTD